jgi:threonyl-tRNA synthetase
LGKSEEEQDEITIRKHNGETLGQMSVENFCDLLNKEVISKK